MIVDDDEWRRTVSEGAATLGVAVSPSQARALGRHAREMLAWNRVSNLTAITDPMAVAVKHYVDALAVAPWIGRSARVLDAGSGGGFPGIPLKIVRPDLSITLVDSVRKKVSFLQSAIRTLQLDGIDALHGRLEAISRSPRGAGRFDAVVCRALGSLTTFIDRTVSFLAPGGILLAMKGPQTDHDPVDEPTGQDGILRLSGRCFKVTVHAYRLPFIGDRRRMVRLVPIAENGRPTTEA